MVWLEIHMPFKHHPEGATCQCGVILVEILKKNIIMAARSIWTIGGHLQPLEAF